MRSADSIAPAVVDFPKTATVPHSALPVDMGAASDEAGLVRDRKKIPLGREPGETVMQTTLSIALRAHAVLLSASVAVLTAVCLCIVLLLHVPLDDPGLFGHRATLFGIAVLGALFVRHKARCAFRAALQTRQIRLSDFNANGIFISDGCPHAWLVQMYAELCPVAARRQIESGSPARNVRGPKASD
ncbi:hypothetical protein ABH944_003598 [Caballeronia udeis]|jgi:hypothetical protein|uniref:Lipoprotein n=1 Tax=Caballeronia udeis TaxID=1232866 RepID=A0ABW8MKB1_9BURK